MVDMLKLIIVCGLFVPSLAFAQQAPQQNPMEAAMGSEIMECVGSKVQLRARVNALEAANAARPAPAPQPSPAPPEPPK